jgi:hypothetical protein
MLVIWKRQVKKGERSEMLRELIGSKSHLEFGINCRVHLR